MTFSHFNRRLHLYLGLFLLPWFFMYGVSSLVFSHPKYVDSLLRGREPEWTLRFDRPYEIDVSAGADLRAAGGRIMKDSGLDRAYGVYQENDRRFHVWAYSFQKATRIVYKADEKRLVAEDQRFRWDHFLTSLHARGGFEQEGFLDTLWAAVVDLACLGMLLWIATGLYMWWHLRHLRGWGAAALAAGVGLFVALLR